MDPVGYGQYDFILIWPDTCDMILSKHTKRQVNNSKTNIFHLTMHCKCAEFPKEQSKASCTKHAQLIRLSDTMTSCETWLLRTGGGCAQGMGSTMNIYN